VASGGGESDESGESGERGEGRAVEKWEGSFCSLISFERKTIIN